MLRRNSRRQKSLSAKKSIPRNQPVLTDRHKTQTNRQSMETDWLDFEQELGVFSECSTTEVAENSG